MAIETTIDLQGWELRWWRLEIAGGDSAELLRGSEERARNSFDRLAEHPTCKEVRRLFRQAGCDPTRYRPSSEALLRRVLKGDSLPRIHPFVDLNNALSIDLAVPACVMAEGSFEFPVRLRAGVSGELMDSLRGPFKLEGKPLMEDRLGAFGTPITDSLRVKVESAVSTAWMVAYIPAAVLSQTCATTALETLLEMEPVAKVCETFGCR